MVVGKPRSATTGTAILRQFSNLQPRSCLMHMQKLRGPLTHEGVVDSPGTLLQLKYRPQLSRVFRTLVPNSPQLSQAKLGQMYVYVRGKRF